LTCAGVRCGHTTLSSFIHSFPLCCRRDASAKGDARAAQLPAIIAAADAVIAAINTSELAAFMALRAPADTDEANGGSSSSSEASTGSGSSSSYKQQKAEKDAAKAALLEALRVKLKAQLEVAEVRGSKPQGLRLVAVLFVCLIEAAKAALLEALRVKLKVQLEVAQVRGSNPGVCLCHVACVLHGLTGLPCWTRCV
jgi:hypothetical protein